MFKRQPVDLDTRALVLLVAVQQPAAFAVGALLQINHGSLKPHFGQHGLLDCWKWLIIGMPQVARKNVDRNAWT